MVSTVGSGKVTELTRQQTRFITLMEGWKQAGKYAKEAADSAGIAAQKLTIYQESLEAKSQKVAAAFENFSMSLLSDDLVGGLYDLAAGFLNLVAELPSVAKDGAMVGAALTGIVGAVQALQHSGFTKAFKNLLPDLGWPEMTGDKLQYCA